MKKIFLFSGKAEHGKTAAGDIFQTYLEERGHKVLRTCFAEYLKFVARKHFGWDGEKNEKGRKILQYVGTDVARKNNPKVWAVVASNLIYALSSAYDYAIIDDLRFLNEIEAFHHGTVSCMPIRVVRYNKDGSIYENSLTEEQRKHESETQLDDYPFGIYISSFSGLENLKKAILPSIEAFIF